MFRYTINDNSMYLGHIMKTTAVLQQNKHLAYIL